MCEKMRGVGSRKETKHNDAERTQWPVLGRAAEGPPTMAVFLTLFRGASHLGGFEDSEICSSCFQMSKLLLEDFEISADKGLLSTSGAPSCSGDLRVG